MSVIILLLVIDFNYSSRIYFISCIHKELYIQELRYHIHKDQFTGEYNLVIGVHCVRMNLRFNIKAVFRWISVLCLDGYRNLKEKDIILYTY